MSKRFKENREQWQEKAVKIGILLKGEITKEKQGGVGMEDAVMYSEVYSILNILGDDYIRKIPQELFAYIENNRDKEHEKKFDRYKSIEEQGYLDKTIEFISFLNLDYWADDDERAKLMKVYAENDKKYEEELRKKYMPNGIHDPFNKSKASAIDVRSNSANNEINEVTNHANNDTALSVIDESNSIFKRIANFFKKILAHKNG